MFGLLSVAVASPALAEDDSADDRSVAIRRHAIETSPLSATIGVYQIQYNYSVSPSSALVLGAAFANAPETSGRSGSGIAGYRHYFWRHLFAEYQLWAGYYRYPERIGSEYRGLQVFNELRAGYQFNIPVGDVALTLTPGGIFGFHLVEGARPDGFDASPWVFPNVALGLRF